jgi:hypothetical protein
VAHSSEVGKTVRQEENINAGARKAEITSARGARNELASVSQTASVVPEEIFVTLNIGISAIREFSPRLAPHLWVSETACALHLE